VVTGAGGEWAGGAAGVPGEAGAPRGWLARTLAGWRSGRGSLPSTSAGVEICALTVFLGVRAVNLGQLAVSLPDAMRHTTSPGLFLGVLACYLLESVLLGVAVVRAGAYRDPRLGALDVGTAVLVLLLQPAFVPPGDIVGSWTAWGFACTLGSAYGAAVVFRRRRATALAVLALSCGYLLGSLFAVTDAERAAVLANAFSYAGFAVLARLMVGYLRRLGASAEEARRLAAETARQAELERQRVLLHDNISVLRLLSRTDLPPDLAEPLQAQATALANKVRAFLDDARVSDWAQLAGAAPDGPGGADRPERELVAVVRAAAEGFWDLRLALNLDLAHGTPLAGPAAAAVEAAVATLLHNARLHAAADSVVVHADVDEAAGEWEVTVRDDGRGFDPGATPLGFGLRFQVRDTLARHGIRTDLRSRPGDGTTVTLRGPLGGAA
jgi:signal transduction histidine kinase